MDTDLPYLDEHRLVLDAPPVAVWQAVRRYAATSLLLGEQHPLGRMLGTRPRAGFEVAEEIPEPLLGTSGRHRFARYLLEFEVAPVAAERTLLTARSYAELPGLRGRIYRALVVGTGGHVLATRGILRRIRRSLER